MEKIDAGGFISRDGNRIITIASTDLMPKINEIVDWINEHEKDLRSDNE